MKLQTRLLWVVLPLLAFAVLISVVGMSFYSKQTVLRQAQQDGLVLARVLGRSIQVSRSVEQTSEQIISRDLTSTARVLAQLVAVAEQCRLPVSDITARLETLVNPEHLSEIWITDPEGRAYLHTVPDVDFQFSPDPVKQPQASRFWPLLEAMQPKVVVQELKLREVDGRPFKYVGVSGVDRPRIVQVGMDGQSFTQLQKSLGVQELLQHVVKEESILSIWMVNPTLEIEAFAETNGNNGQRALTAADRDLLQKVIEQGGAESRVDDEYIAVAVRLMAPDHPSDNTATHKEPTTASGDEIAGHAILLHMTTAMLDELINQETTFAEMTTVLTLLMGSFLIVWFTRHMLRPIHTAVAIAERVAAGDLSVTLTATDGNDEISKLDAALGRMVSHLNSLIGQVQRSTGDLVSTANRMSTMYKVRRDEVSTLGSTTTEIAAATREISATSEELLNTMSGISTITDHTTELASSGQTSLDEMEATMRSLADATRLISEHLTLINQKAETISHVTTTITRIADQTNLLSLNASIEAAKSGQYGLGFAELAREIRQLADQTAVSTLDIEQMVREMQESVNRGVTEMNTFSTLVNRSVSDVHTTSQRFGEIIDQIQALLPQFDAVHEGMRSQSTGAREIRDSMVSLTETVRLSLQALEETHSANQTLEAAIDDLRQEISRFRVG